MAKKFNAKEEMDVARMIRNMLAETDRVAAEKRWSLMLDDARFFYGPAAVAFCEATRARLEAA